MTTLPRETRAVHLVGRPVGEPTPELFAVRPLPLPELTDGQVLVANTVLSVDPYMRGRMNDVRSYVPPFALDAPLDGGAVGVVLASRAAHLPAGTAVSHGLGWREHAVVDATACTPVDTTLAPAGHWLGVLGMPGLTAYAGLVAVAGLHPGETVFVSGAAGAVGSLAGQFARRLGAHRVIGSAGTADKARWLTETVGYDAAFCYRDAPVAEQLAAAAPQGVHVYFDNVGGEHLEAALAVLRPHGRVAVCGAISAYNASEPPAAPRNLTQVIGKRLTLRGFIVTDHADLQEPFRRDVSGWLADGDLVVEETVVDGLDNAAAAFLALLRGGNTGKMLVRVGDATA